MSKKYWAHPTALIESEMIGCGTRIWAFTHVMRNVRVGDNCNIGEHCFVETGASIGNNVTIKNGNLIWNGVTLEDGVFVGPNATFTNELYPRSARLAESRQRYLDQSWLMATHVRSGASIGAAAVILPNVTIEEFAMVAAGAVVTKNVPHHALVMGSPARVRGWVCKCGRRIEFSATRGACSSCNRTFTLQDGRVQEEEQRTKLG
jgi:UDP-2-acetamido-3-amino-2,3-dideoxy-glucuronate N-acetyltransferase